MARQKQGLDDFIASSFIHTDDSTIMRILITFRTSLEHALGSMSKHKPKKLIHLLINL